MPWLSSKDPCYSVVSTFTSKRKINVVRYRPFFHLFSLFHPLLILYSRSFVHSAKNLPLHFWTTLDLQRNWRFCSTMTPRARCTSMVTACTSTGSNWPSNTDKRRQAKYLSLTQTNLLVQCYLDYKMCLLVVRSDSQERAQIWRGAGLTCIWLPPLFCQCQDYFGAKLSWYSMVDLTWLTFLSEGQRPQQHVNGNEKKKLAP